MKVESRNTTDGSKRTSTCNFQRKEGKMAFVPNKLVAALLAIILGGLGIHRFLKGHILSGVIWLLTGGGFVIGWLSDVIYVITNKELIFQK